MELSKMYKRKKTRQENVTKTEVRIYVSQIFKLLIKNIFISICKA